MSTVRDRKLTDRRRNAFNPDEDDRLRELVGKFGESSWRGIAAKMPKRNRRQCRERWFNYLSPIVSNGPWTELEEDLLRRQVSEIGHKWRVIQSFFPGRTDINIKNHWKQMQKVRGNHAPLCDLGTENHEDPFDQLIGSWLREKSSSTSATVPDPDQSWMIWRDL
jgi:hypothetical protein